MGKGGHEVVTPVAAPSSSEVTTRVRGGERAPGVPRLYAPFQVQLMMQLRLRRGMTMVELMIVITITSSLALLAAPRFKALRERSALRSSRQQIEAMIATARAAAIQKGRSATFYVNGQAVGVRVVVNDAGSTVNLVAPTRLDSLHGVTLTLGGSADTAIVFSPRGYATPRLGGTVVYTLQIGSRRDSTCVPSIGHILGQACAK